jgi:hypothetical protein
MSEDDNEDPLLGKTSIRMGPAFLNWVDATHLGLFRRIITVTNDGGQIIRREHPQPVGPLGIYRRSGKGDTVHMRTSDPKTGEPIDLTLEWRPGQEGGP